MAPPAPVVREGTFTVKLTRRRDTNSTSTSRSWLSLHPYKRTNSRFFERSPDSIRERARDILYLFFAKSMTQLKCFHSPFVRAGSVGSSREKFPDYSHCYQRTHSLNKIKSQRADLIPVRRARTKLADDITGTSSSSAFMGGQPNPCHMSTTASKYGKPTSMCSTSLDVNACGTSGPYPHARSRGDEQSPNALDETSGTWVCNLPSSTDVPLSWRLTWSKRKILGK